MNIEIVQQSQDFYDAYNTFMISSDLKIFGKLLARYEIFDRVKNIPGDIVECGVFKGTGIFSFLKLKRYLCPNSLKKVIGFDFFNNTKLIEGLQGIDKESMSTLFDGRQFEHTQSFKDNLESEILSSGFYNHEFELISGDISETVKDFVNQRIGAKISLLYLDLDLEIPTYNVLTHLWDRVSSGGIIVFDEYAHHYWSESIGVDRFFKDKNITIHSMNFICPSAYVIKP